MAPSTHIHLRLRRPIVSIVWLAHSLLLVSPFIALSSTAPAAPIEFAFEATIDTVVMGIPFDLGLDYQVGDKITGKFMFDPIAGDGEMYLESQQPYKFSLDVNGHQFKVESFEIQSVNDSPTSDFLPVHVSDFLVLGSGGLTPINASAFPNLDPTRSNVRMELYGPDDVLSTASVPPSLLVWNSFDLRRPLIVTFRDGLGGATGFQAMVEQFRAVPEPTGYQIAWILSLSTLAIQRRVRFALY